jgi:two-component system LytT family response regulator
MSRLRAVVIDDERLARRELRGLLAAHEAIEVVGEAASEAEALELIARVQPEVLFLDVQLCPGTGFDLLDRITQPLRVVFVTAFDAFALRAFEVNALDYLLKPINPQRLHRSMIVNLACVERLESALSRGYLVHLRGLTTPVPMSRRRATILKTRFG